MSQQNREINRHLKKCFGLNSYHVASCWICNLIHTLFLVVFLCMEVAMILHQSGVLQQLLRDLQYHYFLALLA